MSMGTMEQGLSSGPCARTTSPGSCRPACIHQPLQHLAEYFHVRKRENTQCEMKTPRFWAVSSLLMRQNMHMQSMKSRACLWCSSGVKSSVSLMSSVVSVGVILHLQDMQSVSVCTICVVAQKIYGHVPGDHFQACNFLCPKEH